MSCKFMVSFDVESLYTNIPLEECIDLAVNYISKGNPNIKLSKPDLRSLFNTATAQTHFIFNGSFYDQIDGVAMGSPLLLSLLTFSWDIMKNFGCKIFMALQFYFIIGMLMILFAYLTQIAMPLYFSTISTLGTLTSGSL